MDACFSPDGQWLAAIQQGEFFPVLFDGASLTPSGVCHEFVDKGAACKVLFSLDSESMIVGLADGSVRRFSVPDFEYTSTGISDALQIQSATLSSCGRRLATTHLSGNVFVWNLATGQCELVLSHRGSHMPADATPVGAEFVDGDRYLLTGATDGRVRRWSMRTAVLIAHTYAWAPEYHHLYPDTFRRLVRELLLLWQCRPSCALAVLPYDVLLYIMQLVAEDAFDVYGVAPVVPVVKRKTRGRR